MLRWSGLVRAGTCIHQGERKKPFLNLCEQSIYICRSLQHTQDICGIICAVMTWLLILYAEFVVMIVIILPNPYPVYSTINMIIFNLLAFLAYASHIRTMFSDPVCEKKIYSIHWIDWINWLNRLVFMHLLFVFRSLLIHTITGSCAKGQCN